MMWMILLSFIPAYGEIMPDSFHGYETIGGNYSQIWLDWNGANIVNATMTLPDRNWNNIVIPLEITKYSHTDNGISMFSQINKFAQILFTGNYIDSNTMLLDARLSIKDNGIVRLQYIGDIISKEIETEHNYDFAAKLSGKIVTIAKDITVFSSAFVDGKPSEDAIITVQTFKDSKLVDEKNCKHQPKGNCKHWN